MKCRPSVVSALILFVIAAFLHQSIGLVSAARPVLTDDPDRILWTNITKGVVSSPALSPDGLTLYISSQDRRLHAIDTLSGEEKWTNALKFPGTLSSPVLDGERIYVGGADGRLYGIIDQGDFGEIDLRSTSLSRPLSTPAIGADGTVYVGTTGRRLYSLTPEFPGFFVNWSYLAPDDVRPPVVTDDGTILIVSGGHLRGVNEDGTEASAFTPRSAIKSLPAVAEDGTIQFGANDERVYALGSGGTTNDVLWRFDTDKNVTSSGAIGADGRFYIASENSRLYCFTINGVVRWKAATKAPIRSAISIGVDGTIYAGCDDGRLYAFSPEDGTILWTVKTKTAVRTSPVLDAFGVVYFGSGKVVYAVQTEAMADDTDEPAWPMFRGNAQHTARATECRPFLIEEPHRVGDTTGAARYDATIGEPLSIAVVVRAGASVSYQWRLNGAEIDPDGNRTATNATYVIASVSAADAGDYTVHAFNDCGEVESDRIFTLNLTNAPPIITSNITNQFLLAGSPLILQIGAAGTVPLAFQWFFNSNAIPFATNTAYEIANAQPSDSGVYFVTVTNPHGTNESFHATISVFSNVLALAGKPLGAGQR
ncbi:MAG TPA: PQQ-binding-like beta-propeller repeat protein, partial [Candidatus Limnocylindria bacterium]|nr:PQQ-binding-like beta-propeller repeat protein [Candidatus Limnocylindria bacterium]